MYKHGEESHIRNKKMRMKIAENAMRQWTGQRKSYEKK